MTARRAAFANSGFLALLSLLILATPLIAQDEAQPAVENSKYQIVGVINSNAVYVRSGASENDYPTLKLDKGAEITVVGERFDWLKIVPPEGSFCYVAKAYVNRSGNGSFGQVTSPLNARIGSALNPLKTKVGAKLEPNQRVEIIGEQDEYFKIKPPADVFFYISKQFVEPLRQADPVLAQQTGNAGNAGATEPQTPASPENGTGTGGNLAGSGTTPVAPTTNTGQANTQNPPEQANTGTPTSQPTALIGAEFDKLEASYAAVSQQPVDQQPVEELLAGYQKVVAAPELPESLRRIAEFKINVLKTRVELKSQYVAGQKNMQDMQAKQQTLQQEKQELEQRVKETTLTFYTAVGTLRPSSLQIGQQMLFRLTDPANGRTIVYLRSNDTSLGQHMGQFVGVKGELTDDAQMNLRFITPTSCDTVNPSQLGHGIVAQIAPPSLLPGGMGTASTND